MKCKFALGLALAALACSALGQSTNTYLNTGNVLAPPQIPPQIDAGNFVNQSLFVINFTNTIQPLLPPPIGQLPYATQNTWNYTNTAFMSCNAGFDFETYVPGTGVSNQNRQASTFFNSGTINCGTLDTSNYLTIVGIFNIGITNYSIVAGLPGTRTFINASNIVNPGAINLGFESLLSIVGNDVDLTGASLFMAPTGATFQTAGSTSISFSFDNGIFDNGWGLGTPDTQPLAFYPFGFDPAFLYGATPPQTPLYDVTSRQGATYSTQMILTNAFTYWDVQSFNSGSNVNYRVVYISNPNPTIAQKVFFLPDGTDVVEFTNTLGTSSNNIYITDLFGAVTNFYLLLSGFAGTIPTFIPYNYSVFEDVAQNEDPFLGAPTPSSTLPGGESFFEPSVRLTNQYTAYDALFQASSVVLSDTFGQDVTNVPGRIEITANNQLNLAGATIDSLNYIKIQCTNNLISNAGAKISAPYIDLILGCTNGLITITNLLQPSIAKPSGDINLYSARWTNVVASVTNSYAVLFVQANVAPSSQPYLRTLDLRSTNISGGPDGIVISDILNVSNLFYIDTHALTLTTNGAGAISPDGQINILTDQILWPSSLPRLEYLTNNGMLSSVNEMVFGGPQTSPYSSVGAQPYTNFINTGIVTNYGSQIDALYFNDSGVFDAIAGTFDLEQAQTAILTNGMVISPFGGITLNSASLFASNEVLNAGGTITFDNPYYLDDGSFAVGTPFLVTNKNVWNSGGIALPVLPVYASLLATTITNASFSASPASPVTWAANDVGNSPAGFDSAALGHLILVGVSNNCQFSFNPAGGGGQAIYVDLLELNQGAQAQNVDGNTYNVKISPGMTVYYSEATADGQPFSEKLNGRYGVGPFGTPTDSGRFIWVSNYNCGFFSSTTETNSSGVFLVNAALRFSTTIDSDNAGTPNYLQISPIPVSQAGCPVGVTGYPAAAPAVVPAMATVQLMAPADGAAYHAPAAVTLTAKVTANGHTIHGVTFYSSGGNVLGTATAPPYSVTWSNVTQGTYAVGAKASYDNNIAALANVSTIYVEALRGLGTPPVDTNTAAQFIAGSYHGLFSDPTNGVNPVSAGYFTANTTSRRVISAKISVGGHTYPFLSHFQKDGSVSGTTSSGGLKFALQLSSDSQQIQGTISGKGWSAALQADLQTSRADNTFAGKYTMIIPPSTDGPEGYGFGTVNVDAAGNLKWSGSLADGTKVTQSSAVSQQGFWPLYSSLYGGKGEIVSWMQFDDGSLNGDQIWIKPAVKTKNVPGPFTSESTASGGLYHNQKPAVGLAIFSGAGVSLTNEFTLGSNNHAKDITLSKDKLSLGVTASSGLFSGSIANPNGHGRLNFSGVVWSPTNAVGFFLNDGQSGSVILQPQQ